MEREVQSSRSASEKPFLRNSVSPLSAHSVGGLDLIDLHHCRTVAFDSTEVVNIEPDTVRALISVRRRCRLGQLFGASDEICAQLRMANLSQFFEMNVEDFGEGASRVKCL